MIIWSLAVILTAGVLAIIYLPYRALGSSLGGPLPDIDGQDKPLNVEHQINHVLHLWYCHTCGGRLDKLDQKVCSHCGASLGEEGGPI